MSLPTYLLRLVLGAAIFVMTPASGHALLKELDLGQSASTAGYVVRGTVRAVETCWDTKRQLPATCATVEVSEQIKGAGLATEIAVCAPGGETGDVAIKVSDTPSFRQGEEVIIFLKDAPLGIRCQKSQPLFSVLGKAQGKYTIEDGQVYHSDPFSVLDRSTGEVKALSRKALKQDAVPVNEFLERIRKAVHP